MELLYEITVMKFLSLHNVCGTVMQIEKALGIDPLLVSKVS